MDVKWIKMSVRMFDDEAIMMIDSLPNADAILNIWVKLLCLAGKQNNDGIFIYKDKYPYTSEMLSTLFRRNEEVVADALEVLADFELIEITEGIISIPNWSKYQNFKEKDDRITFKLGKTIKQLRDQRGITQAELAEELDVSRAYMSMLEKGERLFDRQKLQCLSRTLDIPYESFFDEKVHNLVNSVNSPGNVEKTRDGEHLGASKTAESSQKSLQKSSQTRSQSKSKKENKSNNIECVSIKYIGESPVNNTHTPDEDVKCQLGKEKLTQTEFNELVQSFGLEIVEGTVQRIMDKPYYGCLNAEKIRSWCEEVKKKQSKASGKNGFKNFEERKYDYDALEKQLAGR